ncbi:MAG: YitT family protein, partial [Rikenellaceae bacterium]
MKIELNLSKQILHWIYIVLGAFLMAAGFSLFINPYNLIPGGVYGLGVALHYIFPDIQVGTFGWLLDIPLLITSFLVFGGKLGLKTIVAAFLVPLFMNFPQWLWGVDNPVTYVVERVALSDDLFLSSILG